MNFGFSVTDLRFILLFPFAIEQTIAVGARNVKGQSLSECSKDPLTGYFRDGFCNFDTTDHGTHVVCAVVNEEFLRFPLSFATKFERYPSC